MTSMKMENNNMYSTRYMMPKVISLPDVIFTLEGQSMIGGFNEEANFIFLTPGSSWLRFKVLLHEVGHWLISKVTREEYSMWDAMLDGIFKIWYWHWRYEQ